ncbi:exoribonuclease [Paraburkholderia caribensis MBA4]|uniref:Exoribonuclease n=1 Tax=Paraburkholderia caribensis MBA4 TaxID=1323664 RepID=A0A0P0RKL5_9BURK|nr:exoribonuclease [Paraburkholderia caribensis MBA4]
MCFRGSVFSGFALASAGWLFWPLRWHPQVGCSGLFAGIRRLVVLAFALASAIR